MSLKFTEVKDAEQIKKLSILADEIWHEHYTAIISNEQIDYMLDSFQSFEAIHDQLLKQGYIYYFLEIDDKEIGYIGIKHDGEKLFLSKLYILKYYRGKGYASQAFELLDEICRQNHLVGIWLNVNRQNSDSIKVYEKKGFKIIKEHITDVGNGFVMDDYLMEKMI